MQGLEHTNKETAISPHVAHSQRLIACLISLESQDEDKKRDAKMELIIMTSALMPHGKPALLEMRNYPQIAALAAEHGRKSLLKVIFLIIQNFCSSVNVVRNMSEDQMIEAAAMMLDECGNFRLEDYQLMFAMAKRGQLVRIMDRIDISLISQMMDEYWRVRNAAGRAKEEDITFVAPANPVPGEKVSAFLKEFTEKLRGEIDEDSPNPSMDEQEYQRIRTEFITKQMKEKAKQEDENRDTQ